jgi:hypothetical protein
MTEHHDPKTAEEILDNFETIVRRERLIRGSYMIFAEFLSELGVPERGAAELQRGGAICNGARACALGSMALAARVSWEGSDEFNALARGFGDPPPGLAEAMGALDEAAYQYAVEHGIDTQGIDRRIIISPDHRAAYDDRESTHTLEQLFENPTLEQLSTLPEYTGPDTWYPTEGYGAGPDSDADPDLVNDAVSVGMTGVILEVIRRARLLLPVPA